MQGFKRFKRRSALLLAILMVVTTISPVSAAQLVSETSYSVSDAVLNDMDYNVQDGESVLFGDSEYTEQSSEDIITDSEIINNDEITEKEDDILVEEENGISVEQ